MYSKPLNGLCTFPDLSTTRLGVFSGNFPGYRIRGLPVRAADNPLERIREIHETVVLGQVERYTESYGRPPLIEELVRGSKSRTLNVRETVEGLVERGRLEYADGERVRVPLVGEVG